MRDLVRIAYRTVNPIHRVGDTIVVSGSPRSGTTYVAEALAHAGGLDLLIEPLNLRQSPAGIEAGFSWATAVEPHEPRARLRRYVHNVLRGGVEAGWMHPASGNNGLLVKFVRAQRMLGWLTKNFAFGGTVMVLRHPCAVVASQIAMGEREGSPWAHAQPPDPSEVRTAFDCTLPDAVVEQFGDVLGTLRGRADTLAAHWALDQYLVSRHWRPGMATVAAYESMLNDPTVVESLCETLGVPPASQLHGPSRVAAPDLDLSNPERQLSKWRQQLSTREVDAILRVTHAFGLDFYGSDPMPDLARISDWYPSDGQDG